MKLHDLITPETALYCINGKTKKKILYQMSKAIAKSIGIKSKIIANALLQREQLGSTSIGGGVAIPHCRLKELAHPIGILARLKHYVDFNDPTQEPVDLVFALLVPEQPDPEHLQILTYLTKQFKDTHFCDRLRQAESQTELYRSVIEKSAVATSQ